MNEHAQKTTDETNGVMVYIFSKIKLTRNMKKYTIMELSEISDLSTTHINNVENGRQMKVSFYILYRLTAALDLDLAELIKEGREEYRKHQAPQE